MHLPRVQGLVTRVAMKMHNVLESFERNPSRCGVLQALLG